MDELVEFVNAVWTHSYAGRMTFPCWTSQFFEWQFRLDNETSRQNLIAAYDGPVLAGVLLGTNFLFRSPGGIHCGSQWSWLSIHPDYRGRGIAKALNQERIVRQAAATSRLIVSYRYVGSSHSQTERPRKESPDRKFNRKIGFWARVIDPIRFSRWHWSRMEGLLARMTSPFTRIPSSARTDSFVRSFVSADLDACLHLARESTAASILSIAWDHDSLRHQLCGNRISQTLVVEESGVITGFVNFYLLNFQAKTVEKVAILDLIVLRNASSRSRVRLLNAALARMQDQGVALALKVRCGDTPSWPMLRTHFVPQPPDSILVVQSVGDPVEVPKSGSIHVLWR
jgi:GNAT superfamily N-acetyltransferase